VTALADEPARLICALHVTIPLPGANKALLSTAAAVGNTAIVFEIAGLIRGDFMQVNELNSPLNLMLSPWPSER
jgi:hypothetical protein